MKSPISAVGPTLAALVVSVVPPWAHAAHAARAECFGRPATIVGTNHADRIKGTPGDDVIVGRGGLDVINGQGGDDRICAYKPKRLEGGPGNDWILDRKSTWNRHIKGMYGGRGDDLLITRDQLSAYGGPGKDRIQAPDGAASYGGAGDDDMVSAAGWPNPGPGNDTVRSLNVSFYGSKHYVVVDLQVGTANGEGHDTLIGVERVEGSKFSDVINGDARDNYFDGAGGVDALYGRDGNDELDTNDGLAVGGSGLDGCYASIRVSCFYPHD